MNREIKFRGKAVNDGRWVYGYFHFFEGAHIGYQFEKTDQEAGVEHCFEWFEVAPETVGQFTGLLDKNGKEIFDGDLVRDDHRIASSQVLQVFWSDRCGAFFVHNNPRSWSEHLDGVADRVEIIGNITDNPDLVK